MKTLQTKLLLGLLPTLAILVVLGLWAIIMFYRLGGNIDVILRENYTSILAAEGMKEAIERMDSGLLFAVGGRDRARPRAVRRQSPAVSRAPESRAGQHHAPRRRRAGRFGGASLQPVRRARRAVLRAAGRAARAASRGVLSASCCRRSRRSRRTPTRSWRSTRRT